MNGPRLYSPREVDENRMARGLPTTAQYERMAAEWFPLAVERYTYTSLHRRVQAALRNARMALYPEHRRVHIGYARLFAAACRARLARATTDTTSPEGQ